MRRIFSGDMTAGDDYSSSDAGAPARTSAASVTSKSVAAAAKVLSDALDYLEAVDMELEECLDWSPGTRRGSAGKAAPRMSAVVTGARVQYVPHVCYMCCCSTQGFKKSR